MNISEVEIVFITPKQGLIGFVSFTVDQNFYFSSVGIHRKLDGGFRLTYPQKNGFTLFHPTNKTVSKAIEEAVFQHLKNVITINNDRHDSTFDTTR